MTQQSEREFNLLTECWEDYFSCFTLKELNMACTNFFNLALAYRRKGSAFIYVHATTAKYRLAS